MTTTLKTCFKCFVNQPIDNFYRHNKMADGHLGKCKDCARKDVTENRYKRRDYYNQFDRNRYRSLSVEEMRERKRKINQAIYKTEEIRKIKNRDRSKKSYLKDLKKSKARYTLGNAIRSGHIIRPNACWHCGSQDSIHGHHSAYDLPLAVTWLCSICHGLAHRITNDCIREAEMASNQQIAA